MGSAGLAPEHASAHHMWHDAFKAQPYVPSLLQGFSTISTQPCGGYSWCATCPGGQPNTCYLKG